MILTLEEASERLSRAIQASVDALWQLGRKDIAVTNEELGAIFQRLLDNPSYLARVEGSEDLWWLTVSGRIDLDPEEAEALRQHIGPIRPHDHQR